MMHELTEKIYDIDYAEVNCWDSADKFVREWLEEKAERLKELNIDSNSPTLELNKKTMEILGLSEKTLEEKFKEYIENSKNSLAIKLEPYYLAKIAEEHMGEKRYGKTERRGRQYQKEAYKYGT